MFVFKNGMPLVNKTSIAYGLLKLNYSIPYTGNQLALSSDYRYTVRVYTGKQNPQTVKFNIFFVAQC